MSQDLDFEKKLSGALDEMSERHIEEAAKAVRLEHNGLKVFRNIAVSAGAVAVAAAVVGVMISNMPEKRRGVDLVESSQPIDPAALLGALPQKAAETEALDKETPPTAVASPDTTDDVPLAERGVLPEQYTVPENVPEELMAIDPVKITDEHIQSGSISENSVPELLYATEEGFLVFTDGAGGVYSCFFRDNSRLLSEAYDRFTCFDYKKTISAVESLLQFNSRDITFGAGAVGQGGIAIPLIYALSGENELLCWKYDNYHDSPTVGKFVLMSRAETNNEYMGGFTNLGGALPGSSDPETADTARVGKSEYSITFDEGRRITSIRIRCASADADEVCVPLPSKEEFKSMIDVSGWALPLDKGYTPDTDIYRRFENEPIAVPEMSPVYAADDGVIVYYDYANGSSGGIVMVLMLDSGEYVVYSHLHSFKADGDIIDSAYPERELKTGDRVTKGQIIARTGSTGFVEGTARGVRALTPDEYAHISEKYKWLDEENEKSAFVWYDEMNLAQDFIYNCYFCYVYKYGSAISFSDYIDNVYLREYAELAVQYEKPRVPEGDENYTRMTSFCDPAHTIVGDTHYISLTMMVEYVTDVGYGYAGKAENSFEYKCVVALRDGRVVDFSVGNMGGANIAWIYGTRLNPDAFDMTHNPNPWEDEVKARAVLDYYKNAVPVQKIARTDWNALSGEEIWELMSGYSGVDVGSGLYIMTYLIADDSGEFTLTVGGISGSSVGYVTLTHNPSGKTLSLYGEQHSAEEIISFFGEPSRVNCYNGA